MSDLSYPLSWPTGWKRATRPERHNSFRTTSTYSEAVDLHAELERLGATRIVISSNVPVRTDGLPYSGRRTPDDRGVAVYFRLGGRDTVLACDRWDKVEHNLRAIAKHVEALRGIERWGVGSLEQAFTGYAALPEATEETWHSILGVPPDAGEGEIRGAYGAKVREAHPDLGGTVSDIHAHTTKLKRARDEGLAQLL